MMDENKFTVYFGRVIRRLRIEAELSQEDFAAQCNLHRTYIGSIERGEKNVTLLTAMKLAQGLNISLSKLIIETEKDIDFPEDA